MWKLTLLGHSRVSEFQDETTALDQGKLEACAGIDALIGTGWRNDPVFYQSIMVVIDSMTIEAI